VIDAPLALAFGAGMLATINPCGFAMLPAYLGYFLGAETAKGDTRASVQRSLQVGISVSAGFLIVFGLLGVAFYELSSWVHTWLPWATTVIGVGLFVLGLAMLRGYEPVLSLPKLQKGGRDRTSGSMFVFGLSYAVASMSCALPVFTSTVVGTFRRENLISSISVFGAYSLGMILVLLVLTVSMGLARHSIVRWLRRALPFVNRASGLLLVVAGAYLARYGWLEVQNLHGDATHSSRATEVVSGWSADISSWAQSFGFTRLGLLLALALVGVLTVTFGLRSGKR
jgi:cytochrome c biogenesis protein CcdA